MFGSGLDAALVSFLRFIALTGFLIRSSKHAVSIAFVVRNRQVALERFNHLGCLPRFLIFLGQAEQDAAVDGIVQQHLFEDVDSGGSHDLKFGK